MQEVVRLYTDGSWDPKTKNGGWAYLLASQQNAFVRYDGEDSTTNNRMELMAVVEGLKQLQSPCIVQLVCDSKYVVNGISEWIHGWKTNNWKTVRGGIVENVDLWMEIDRLMQVHTLYASWIRAHVKFVQTVKQKANEMVDYFANVGRYENIGLNYHARK